MRIRERKENGELGDFVDLPGEKNRVTIEKLKDENTQLNNQIIDLWEQLLDKGVL
jgi:hypothetical protein